MNFFQKLSLEGKVAIVTGGGSGIGKAISLLFAQAGASVVVAGRTTKNIEATAQEISQIGGGSLAIKTDVTNSDEVNNLIQKTISEFGQIDILVNNAGIAKGIEPSPWDREIFHVKDIWEWTDEMWRIGIETNLSSVFYCSRAVAKYMVEKKKGKIINISSAAGIKPAKGLYTYSTAKAGVIMLTKVLAVSLGRYNIQVNTIAPGNIEVGMDESGAQRRQLPFIPMGRLGKPEEIGLLAVFLASSASDYITGQCFVVDGTRFVGNIPLDWEFRGYDI